MLLKVVNGGLEEIVNLQTGQIYTYNPRRKQLKIFSATGTLITEYGSQVAVALWGAFSANSETVPVYPDSYLSQEGQCLPMSNGQPQR